MTKLLLLGTSLVSVEIIQTAKEMGCYTIVTDNLEPAQSIAKKEADEYWMISTNDIDELEKKCREEHIDAVFAGVSEFNLDRLLELTDRLGLPCYIDHRAWAIARDKEAFKNKCKEFGIPVVDEYPFSDPPTVQELQAINYPVIVKPTDGAGNSGLSICRNEEELLTGAEKARKGSGSGQIVVEKYIKGEEYWQFYFVAGEEIRYVYSFTIFREPGFPSYIYSVVSSAVRYHSTFKKELNDKCRALLKDIGCKEGMAWIQFIRDQDGNFYAVEMAHRLSASDNGRILKKMSGVDSVRWMLDTTLGIKHTPDSLPQEVDSPYALADCVYYQFAKKAGSVSSFQGYEELDPEKYEISFVAHEGNVVPKYRVLARISFAAKSAREMCDMLREINAHTQILDENNENLYINFTDYEAVLKYHKDLFVQE